MVDALKLGQSAKAGENMFLAFGGGADLLVQLWDPMRPMSPWEVTDASAGKSPTVSGTFCCTQRAKSRPAEQRLASVLRSKVALYCSAVEARRQSLAAVDRFYRALMVCQWRLEGIEAQSRAVQLRLKGTAKCMTDKEAMEACLLQLEAQRSQAVASLEERATHYALGGQVASSSGSMKRLAASDAERRCAMQRYRQLASDVFEEAQAEVRAFMLGPAGSETSDRDVWREQLSAALERRLAFWNGELEETWEAWREATARMHNAGHDAICAWREVAAILETACKHFEEHQEKGRIATLQPELESALVTFAACSLEVELINSLGLSGLSSSQEEQQFDRFSLDMRLEVLVSVLELLYHLGLLHQVGEEILSSSAAEESLANTASRHSEGPVVTEASVSMSTPTSLAATSMARKLEALTPSHCKLAGKFPDFPKVNTPSTNLPMPRSCSWPSREPSAAAAICLAAAARMTPSAAALRMAAAAASDDRAEAAQETQSAEQQLLPWLVESLVEAVCAALEDQSEPGDDALSPGLPGELRDAAAPGLQGLLRSCRALGSHALAEAVRSAAENRQRRRQRLGDAAAARELTELEEEALEDDVDHDVPILEPAATGLALQRLSKSCSRLLDLEVNARE
eukprot:TRINITY_DN23137_c0_g1_i1.p1 TRINITY_DN23137_c0_g1~~TRINITY_DN23137_c0_g1_i1.p1  ORF type:complete len:631 (-),score=158.91 TRINITY_DN23137_c0_g1_i1:45-1937(-)